MSGSRNWCGREMLRHETGALQKLSRRPNEDRRGFVTEKVLGLWVDLGRPDSIGNQESGLKSKKHKMSGRSAAW